MATTAKVTADQLWEMGKDCRCELIEGELIEMSPAGGEHGAIGWRLAAYLGPFILSRDLGEGYGSETGFRLGPETVLAPDAAFIRAERLPPAGEDKGFLPLAPDWAVEVVSPSERPAATQHKVYLYLDAGVRLLWVIYPATRTVTVYSQEQPPRTLTVDDTLDGEDVLPGFTLPVLALFER
jgi:Uma2 family endonuclease